MYAVRVGCLDRHSWGFLWVVSVDEPTSAGGKDHARTGDPRIFAVLADRTEASGAEGGQPWVDDELRFLCGSAGRSVWDEWVSTCDLRCDAAMVGTTLPSYAAGLFSAGEHGWDDGILAGWLMDACSDALFSVVPADLVAGDLAGQSGESSAAWGQLSSHRLFRLDGNCGAAAGAVCSRLDERIRGDDSNWSCAFAGRRARRL
jgi:hypothetical protein